MKCLIAAACGVAVMILAGNMALAQHHHGGHHAQHVPIHHGIHYGHQNWNYVVPHRPTYVGAYYSVGHTHYYTPSQITPLVSVVNNPAAPPPAVIEPQRPVELAFGGFSKYQDLAGRLAFEANAMCLDMHYNYKHNKNFAEVYGEAYGVLQAAKYLLGQEHQGDRQIIGRRMAEADKLFHHVQDEMRAWTRQPAKQVGGDGLPEKIAAVEAVMHHLCFDAGVKPHQQAVEAAPAPVDLNRETAPPPPIIEKR